MLKILAGQFRGRPIQSLPKTPLMRPILARVKKSVFDILTPRLAGSRFLDIFSGTGAVGLEALSRGAVSTIFIEKDARCARVIHENIETFKVGDKANVFRLDASGDLSMLPKPFDLIFMGPPYIDHERTPLALVHPTLDNIERHGLLAPGGLVIAQHHKKEPVASAGAWTMVRREHYGDTTVSFFEHAS